MASVEDKVKHIIVEQLGVDAEEVKAEATFVDDLGAYTSTPYGRGLLAKWAGFLILVGFGAYHRFRVIPYLEEERDGRALRRMVRLETIVMLAVVMVAAWLARVSPPAGH